MNQNQIRVIRILLLKKSKQAFLLFKLFKSS